MMQNTNQRSQFILVAVSCQSEERKFAALLLALLRCIQDISGSDLDTDITLPDISYFLLRPSSTIFR